MEVEVVVSQRGVSRSVNRARGEMAEWLATKPVPNCCAAWRGRILARLSTRELSEQPFVLLLFLRRPQKRPQFGIRQLAYIQRCWTGFITKTRVFHGLTVFWVASCYFLSASASNLWTWTHRHYKHRQKYNQWLFFNPRDSIFSFQTFQTHVVQN